MVLKVGGGQICECSEQKFFFSIPHFLTDNLGLVQLQIKDFLLSRPVPYKFNVLYVVCFCLLNDVMLTLPQ